MSIILTTQPNLSDYKTLNMLGDFGDAIGIPGLPQSNRDRGAQTSFGALQSDLNNVIDKLTGRSNQEQFDPSYVGDGRQRIPGGVIQGGKVPALEEANIRQVYSQTPHISVIIKKKAFSGLQHLYNPTLMDSSEKWLLRAIKRLVAAKCGAMAMYERLTKIKRLEELGANPGLILASLISTLSEESGQNSFFSSAMQLQRAQADRQPPDVTTYFVDDGLPLVEELGPGNGIFEITAISTINTSLNLNGSGSCSFEVEDPYRILIVDENDIEMAIRETALSRFVDAVSSAAGLSLTTAQAADSNLQKSRKSENKSAITFSVGVGSNSGVSATIDAIGFEITEDNLNDIPEPHELSAGEQTLFKSVMTNLKNYEFAMRKNTLQGLGSLSSSKIKEEVRYTREKLRLYHMGKAIIQPMDSVHVLIDGGTRRLGETGDIEDPNEKFNFGTVTGSLNAAGTMLGLQNGTQVDDELLEIEWRKEGQHMTFRDFKTLRTLQGSGEGGIHVFGGLVQSVSDKFDASTGKFVLNVSCGSNMEWLKISRFNTSPSLEQVEGIIYDPLTPFKIDVDPATCLPTKKPELLDENQKILSSGKGKPKIYFATGQHTGRQAVDEKDMAQDVRQVGGNIITLYQHAPGLVYRWKPGIMTATYNMSTADPKDGSAVTYKQLRREVGYFSSNTAFDNMDSANIISILVTGFPYNPVRFVQSAMQNGAFSKDTTYNDYRQFFHTFLDVQRSLNVVQGGFTPFKTLKISPADLAKNLRIQNQLVQKSSRLQQVRTQSALLADKIDSLEKEKDARVRNALNRKVESLAKQEAELTNEILGFEKEGKGEYLKGSALYIAGNDITFELAGGNANVKLFGDRLRHAALRRREDIVRGKDSNYLIISDEYDKDYDIQAFILGFRQNMPEMWKGKWETPYAICARVAETLNFEFFVDTQGHLVFRPPQYNRTPASVLNNLFSMEKSTGIGIIPDFLKKLFLSREESLVNDIITLQAEIILNGALLGFRSEIDVQRAIGSDEFFINETGSPYKVTAAKKSIAVDPKEKARFKEIVDKASVAYQLNAPGNTHGGVFNAISQVNLQKDAKKKQDTEHSSDTLYNDARKALLKRRGGSPNSIPEYDKAKIGASKNGQTNKSSDIARIVSNIAELVSRKSKLLLSLGKVLEQTVQIANLDEGGNLKFSPQGLIDTGYRQNSSLYNYLIEDDTKNILGHMSGERFIIKDETIISASFEEKPPDITTVQVNGTEPCVGEGGGNLASIPVYAAYGTDFDLWRQYGWRGETPYDKPFFWSAELQCAPYAVMLLSRQRRNIVTGTITVMGNEYYQLGDVVYITHRNMLYYVESVQHSVSYRGQFSTTLVLKYGHTPGEYIPTPIDVIGKGLVEKGRTSSAYRMRRDIPQNDSVEGVIRFEEGSLEFLNGSDGLRNFEELKRTAIAARNGQDKDPTQSAKIFILSFGGDKNIQDSRADAIRSWFNSPNQPIQPGNGIGADGGDLLSNADDITDIHGSIDNEISNYQINDSYLTRKHIKQTEDYKDLSPSEKELLRSGLVASQKTISMDRTLKNVIELRVRQPSVSGWGKNDK